MVNFNFYDIENLINESSSILTSLFVTFTGTLLGFGGAFYLSNHNDRKLRQKEETKIISLHRSRLKYLTQLIDNSLDTNNKQILRFELLVTEITKDPIDLHLLRLYADNNLQRLQKMETKDIFDAYHLIIPESEESIKNYKDMYGTIDFLFLNLDQMVESYKIYKDNIIRDKFYIKDKIERLLVVMIKWIKDIEINNHNFKDLSKYKFIIAYYKKFNQLIHDEVEFSQYESQFLLPFGEELI